MLGQPYLLESLKMIASRSGRIVTLAVALGLLAGAPVAAQTIYVSLSGKGVEGKPLYWQPDFVALMARDGRLIKFAPHEAVDYRQVSRDFRSHSQATLRGELQREFGRGFDVSGTGQYLVVHPAGQRDQWADRFEQLYRSMQHYLVARGFKIHRPEFPLIAVVFPSQQQYLQYAAQQGRNLGTATLGYYDPETNRIHMFDITAQSGASDQWFINAETIIHEAAHQTAFNVGIHGRFSNAPRWIVEGLGTLFESPGVWDARHHPERSDRVNPSQLQTYRRFVSATNSRDILSLQLSSDQLFRRDPNLAYAHAWALTFFLTEQTPQQYAQLIALTNKRQAFTDYSTEARMQDFISVFGANLPMFDARLQRFIESL